MNRTHLVAATLLALAGTSAWAGGEYDPLVAMPSVSSTLTRAEVKAEVARARAAGELNAYGDDRLVPIERSMPSTRTRAEVKAEVAAAIADGSLQRENAHQVELFPPAVASTLTRQQVREETQAALRFRRAHPMVEGS